MADKKREPSQPQDHKVTSQVPEPASPPIRPGASAGVPPTPQDSAQDEDLRDLFLTEDNLIRLAIGHLGGKLPPRRRSQRRAPDAASGTGLHGSQTARTRRVLAAKLSRELQARCWTAAELAESAQMSVADCRALLGGQGVFTPEVARRLALALATSEGYWQSEGHE